MEHRITKHRCLLLINVYGNRKERHKIPEIFNALLGDIKKEYTHFEN